MSRNFLFCIIFICGLPAHARVFSYKESSIAPYIRGTGGLSSVRQDPFANSSGSDTQINEETKFSYSGEMGLSIGITDAVAMRIGAEVIQHRPVKEAKGLNSTGAERFELDSSVLIFNPNVTFEYIFSEAGAWRFYSMGGAGMAQITVKNEYRMTTLGTSELGPTDFTEKMEGNTYSAHLGAGFEVLFTDNVTLSFDLGYRYMSLSELKYKTDSYNIVAQPNQVHKGDTVVNQDGSTRSLDLSGIFAGLTFRFYLNALQ